METILRSNHVLPYLRTEKRNASVKNFWKRIEFIRFGISPVLLVIIGCLGGLSVAFGAHNDLIKLSLTAFPTIIAVALILGLAPMKAVLYVSMLAVILDVTGLIF